jgi:hypothetical protein
MMQRQLKQMSESCLQARFRNQFEQACTAAAPYAPRRTVPLPHGARRGVVQQLARELLPVALCASPRRARGVASPRSCYLTRVPSLMHDPQVGSSSVRREHGPGLRAGGGVSGGREEACCSEAQYACCCSEAGQALHVGGIRGALRIA